MNRIILTKLFEENVVALIECLPERDQERACEILLRGLPKVHVDVDLDKFRNIVNGRTIAVDRILGTEYNALTARVDVRYEYTKTLWFKDQKDADEFVANRSSEWRGHHSQDEGYTISASVQGVKTENNITIHDYENYGITITEFD